MNVKRTASCVLAACGILLLILDGPKGLAGAGDGIELCIKTVIPALFPFFLFSNVLIGALWGQRIPCLYRLGRLFSLPEGGESILIPAFLGGYPAGAGSIANLYYSASLKRETAEKMLAFCNNAGPSFLFGMIAPAFCEKEAVWFLWGSQILGALTASRIISPVGRRDIVEIRATTQTLSEAMNKALRAIAGVCGWVILFRMLLSFSAPLLSRIRSPEARVLIVGLLELSNGCCMLSEIPNPGWRLMIANTMLSLGGICVSMQTASAAGKLSLRYYYMGKAIQAAVSICLSLVAIWNKRFLLLMLLPVCGYFILKNQKNSSVPKHVGV